MNSKPVHHSWKFQISFHASKKRLPTSCPHFAAESSSFCSFPTEIWKGRTHPTNHTRKPARITKGMAKWAGVKRPDEQNNRCHFGSPLLNRRQAPAPGSSGQGQKSPNKTAQLTVQSRNWIRQNCGKASSWWAGWKKSRPERVSKCNEGERESKQMQWRKHRATLAIVLLNRAHRQPATD